MDVLRIPDFEAHPDAVGGVLWLEATRMPGNVWKDDVIDRATVWFTASLSNWTEADREIIRDYVDRRFRAMVREGCFKRTPNGSYEVVKEPRPKASKDTPSTSTASASQLDSTQFEFPLPLQLALPLSDNLFSANSQTSNPAPRVEMLVSRIVRDTPTALALKELYSDCCQVCGLTIRIGERNYSEVHHLRPLGTPHDGPDTHDNMMVLCPNCHARFDFGGIIWKEDNTVEIEGQIFTLTMRHKIVAEHIEYYKRNLQISPHP
ncbi:MAG TPA: HNH endonuclease [Abditibacteriaceae bacterium]|jgi:putative restriction endonuclease